MVHPIPSHPIRPSIPFKSINTPAFASFLPSPAVPPPPPPPPQSLVTPTGSFLARAAIAYYPDPSKRVKCNNDPFLKKLRQWEVPTSTVPRSRGTVLHSAVPDVKKGPSNQQYSNLPPQRKKPPPLSKFMQFCAYHTIPYHT